jgi:uncharacterized protein YdhG (YjbR/CyaY superfamily)
VTVGRGGGELSATGHDDPVHDAVAAYVEAIPADHRPLFDRVHRLVVATFPDATVGLSYRMPTYRRAGRRLFVGAWQHGISLYGWGQGRDGGFLERHPHLRTSTGTIRLRPQDAQAVPDDDLVRLIRAALTD